MTTIPMPDTVGAMKFLAVGYTLLFLFTIFGILLWKFTEWLDELPISTLDIVSAMKFLITGYILLFLLILLDIMLWRSVEWLDKFNII